ncbi:MAG: efflux RND transporter permease subunit [Candidatus Krumholzibacteria bacterium]|nr:efflux RND transporter permease subunit [Candidatus Krumholzibacteria bacterium]
MNITEFSLKRPVTIMMIFVCFVVIGIISSMLLPKEYFPELDAPFIFVDIPYPGSTPEEIEKQITRPAEEVLATISGVERMSSNSYEGGAWVRLNFAWGVDTDLKALEAREKLDGIRHLFPDDLEKFFIRKFSTSDMQMLSMRISSNRDLSDSYDMLERNIKRRLERISGVSKVDLYGVEKKEIRIQLIADRIIAHHIDINRLTSTLTRSNFLVTAGKITDNGQRLVVRPMGEFGSIEDVGGIVVADNVRLRDIAEITHGHPKLNYGRHLNRKYAIGLDVFKESGANLVETADLVTAEIRAIRELPEMDGINIFYMDNAAEGVESSLSEVLKSGLLGGFLSILVLYFFLRRISSTLIVALSVPLSIYITLAFMYFSGITLNILTMMGLMLAIGMLVDNSVVVTESIHRHQMNGLDKQSAIRTGVSEVSLAITAGTLTTAIVFLPNIVSPNNDISIYLKHVGITICIALGVSLLLAETIVPLFATWLKSPEKSAKETAIDRMQEKYCRLLGWTVNHRKATAGIVWFVLISVAIPVKFVKMDMFNEPDDRRFRLHYHINDNYTVEKVEEAVDVFEDFLFSRQDEFEIESVYSYYQSDYAMSTVVLKKGRAARKPVEKIKELVQKDLPKLAIANPSFEWQNPGGGTESIRIQLVGKSSDYLADLSRDVAWTLSRLEGFSDVRSEAEVGKNEVQVVVDRDLARQYGFSSREVATVVSAAMRGINLRHFRDQDGEVEMRLEFQDTDQQTLEQLRNIPLINEKGQSVSLASLADFSVRRGPNSIQRENRTTSIGVSANLQGITVSEAREKISAVLDNFRFPAGYKWNYGESFDDEQEALQTMLLNLALALALIYFVMASLFESIVFPSAIWTQILFAIVGVYWFFLLTGTKMSLMGMIGILILIGVVVNNGIVLIDYINHLRGKGLGRTEAIIQAGRDRLRPILMTAGTTVLSLVPLCVVGTQIGGDGPPYFPMARAIVGGLVFSTIVTLVILPNIYIELDEMRKWSQRVTSAARRS